MAEKKYQVFRGVNDDSLVPIQFPVGYITLVQQLDIVQTGIQSPIGFTKMIGCVDVG